MKQTASVNECALCAVVPRIRNAGSWPITTGNPDNLTPHNTAKRGTNHDLHCNERRNRKMIEMIFEAILDFDEQATKTRVLFCDGGPRLEREFEMSDVPVPDHCESAEEATYDFNGCQQMANHQGMRAFAAHVETHPCSDWVVVEPKFYCTGGPTS